MNISLASCRRACVVSPCFAGLGMCALLVAGCASSHVTDAGVTAPVVGTVTGKVLESGGPPGVNGKQLASRQPAADMSVTAIRQGSTSVSSVKTDQHGDFAFHLPAGTYTVRACTPVVLTIKSGTSTTHDFDCPVP